MEKARSSETLLKVYPASRAERWFFKIVPTNIIIRPFSELWVTQQQLA
jgi:hypothetical protein